MNSPPYALIASFLAFTEVRNMQKASALLKISQPALTSHLKSFEQYFPQAIFVFEGRRKVLTPFGEKVKQLFKSRFDYLAEDLNLLTEQEQDAKNIWYKIAGRAEILHLLGTAVNCPGTVEFIPVHTESVPQGLRDRKFDIGISYDLSQVGDLHAKKFFTYDYSIVIPGRWKIKPHKLSPDMMEKLVELPYVSHRPLSENYQTLLSKYHIKKKPYYKKVFPDWNLLSQFVSSGEGWSIVPTYYTRDLKSVDVIHIPTSLIPEVQFYMLYRKESFARPGFKNILEQIRKSAEI
ncbi:MAG: LysR family transcriptional regulator [Bdellovibrionota bacterium]